MATEELTELLKTAGSHLTTYILSLKETGFSWAKFTNFIDEVVRTVEDVVKEYNTTITDYNVKGKDKQDLAIDMIFAGLDEAGIDIPWTPRWLEVAIVRWLIDMAVKNLFKKK